MKIYISGKVSGLPEFEYKRRFEEKEIELTAKGYSVVNPVKVNSTLPEDTTYDEYMEMSQMMLSFCDTIYMLKGWEDSPGAKFEYQYAVTHDYMLMFEI